MRFRGRSGGWYQIFQRRKEPVKYIVEARVKDRWIIIGQPYAEQVKASKAVEAAMESGEFADARILVVNKERTIIRIIE